MLYLHWHIDSTTGNRAEDITIEQKTTRREACWRNAAVELNSWRSFAWHALQETYHRTHICRCPYIIHLCVCTWSWWFFFLLYVFFFCGSSFIHLYTTHYGDKCHLQRLKIWTTRVTVSGCSLELVSEITPVTCCMLSR